ncbi:MAG TPA: DUF881 domain-containing protein [Frankiaceae bacterium]
MGTPSAADGGPAVPAPPTAPRRPTPPPLLDQVVATALDPAYLLRASTPRPPGGRSRRAAVGFVALLVAGVLVGITIGLQRQGLADVAQTRARLVTEVTGRTEAVNQVALSVDRQRQQVTAQRDAALAADRQGRAATEALAAAQAAAGELPVTGAGVTVRLTDAPAVPAQPTPSATGATRVPLVRDRQTRVLDRDVQDVVNALWSSGAQAIAVNGIRLSSSTPIRSAGSTILVDFKPVSSPYLVDAVGNPQTLLAGFANSAEAQRFSVYSQVYGLSLSLLRRDRLTLAGAAPVALRVATPLPTTGAPS